MSRKPNRKFHVLIPVLAILVIAILVVSAIMAKIVFWDFLFQIVLTVTSVVLALWYADLGKPRLKLEILDPQKVYIGNIENTEFLKLSVLNQPLKNIPFISRSTAFSCHGSISFLDLNMKLIFEMPIRWSNNPQPIRPDVDQGKIVTLIDQSLIRASRYIDISADEKEELDICYRDPKEKVAIGWNSDSYLIPGGRFPDRILPLGDYIVRVTVKHNDGSVQYDLLLHNPENIDHYKLDSYADQR